MSSGLSLKLLSLAAEAEAEAWKRKGNDPVSLEAQGYRAWYAAIFGQDFVDAWESHHEEAIRWHWETRQRLLRNLPIDHDAYLAIWSRGHMKSTLARRVAICDAALSATANVPGYCLYVGGTDDKKKDHATSLSKLLERRELLRYYPKLGEIQKTARGYSQGDQKDFRYLATGYVFRFASLDASIAGGNIDDTRPTLIIPDDVDERGASAEKYTNRALRFTTELLPMRQHNTLVFGAQNVIQRNTIFHQIYTGKIPALANRFPTKAIPAVRDLRTERVAQDGQPRDIFLSGESTWKVWDARRIQQEIDTMTLEAFLLECQHEVEARKTGLVLNKYDPRKHVISWSQFASVYGARSFPRHWSKYVGHDWGNTHANVTSVIAVAAENSALPGLRFLTGFTAEQQATVDEVALQFIERYLPSVDTSPLREITPAMLAQWGGQGRFSELLDAPREIARQRLSADVERAIEALSFVSFAMSHEQAKNCNVYRTAYGIPYAQVNPGAAGGISDINRDFAVDDSVPDPFRPGEYGLSSLYLVVDDDQLEEARDDYGLKLWREQFLDWSWRETRLTMSGLNDDKPAKVFDDAGNSLMMLYVHSQNLRPAALSAHEERERGLPETLQEHRLAERLSQYSPAESWRALAPRALALAELKKQEEEKRRQADPWGALDYL